MEEKQQLSFYQRSVQEGEITGLFKAVQALTDKSFSFSDAINLLNIDEFYEEEIRKLFIEKLAEKAFEKYKVLYPTIDDFFKSAFIRHFCEGFRDAKNRNVAEMLVKNKEKSRLPFEELKKLFDLSDKEFRNIENIDFTQINKDDFYDWGYSSYNILATIK